MKRAAIAIGVNKTGNLPVLNDAAGSARRFAEWASNRNEGKFDHVELISDESGVAVVPKAIKDVVKAVIDLGTFDQLLIYFSGHGVNIGYSEFWLLSDAPRDPQAAVNVSGSAFLARLSIIPHVVFISDCCRTAAVGGVGQRITGSEIFPNDSPGGAGKEVDEFYACLLGRPALEVREVKAAAREFQAVYTEVLLQALRGKFQNALEWGGPPVKPIAFVRPRKLKNLLAVAVPKRIAELQLPDNGFQEPDAIVSSDQTTAWIARLEAGPGLQPPLPVFGGPLEKDSGTLSSFAQSLLTGGELEAPDFSYAATRITSSARKIGGASELLSAAESTAEPFGPVHHESQCGFKVRGANFVSVESRIAEYELFENPGQVVRVNRFRSPDENLPGASVLLVLENGNGVLLPAIPGFLVALTVRDNELIDVGYEPSDNHPRWVPFKARAKELRQLRAVAAAAARGGVLHLDGNSSVKLAERIQVGQRIDPSLALYAAYADSGTGKQDRLRGMISSMRSDLKACFFDMALLSGELKNRTSGKDPAILSAVPLLAPGWALLRAAGIRLPKSMERLQSTLVSSVWSQFDPEGVTLIRQAFKNQEIL